ncbi:MAG: aminotransferase class V-fold PLP-dependent enzyme [Candidatus Dormibacteria bacterium]
MAVGSVAAEVLGAELEVPLVGGGATRYVNLDYAASAPPLVEVWAEVQAFLPWYSSVHRGAGFRSLVATAAYEDARNVVRDFLGGRPDDTVIFTRNTTDAINLMARCMPAETAVVTTLGEHHANLLPWRRYHDAVELPVPVTPAELLSSAGRALAALPAGRPALLAVTGASNVTGEVSPIAELAALAHRHGARILVDCAQLAPHRPIDVAALDLDWVALSGHKLYAPFGVGALVGRPDWLAAGDAYLAGGGAVAEVSADEVTWTDLPDRHEGGSPNVVGAFAMAAACTALRRIGMERVAADESRLGDLLRSRLGEVPGLVTYATWPDHPDRVAIAAFAVRERDPSEVAAILSAEYGIGVRSGSFCAHPLLAHLAGGPGWRPGCGLGVPGAVRASLGLGSGAGDVERLAGALTEIVTRGPRWRYRTEPDGTVVPDPDDRPLPHWAARDRVYHR